MGRIYKTTNGKISPLQTDEDLAEMGLLQNLRGMMYKQSKAPRTSRAVSGKLDAFKKLTPKQRRTHPMFADPNNAVHDYYDFRGNPRSSGRIPIKMKSFAKAQARPMAVPKAMKNTPRYKRKTVAPPILKKLLR